MYHVPMNHTLQENMISVHYLCFGVSWMVVGGGGRAQPFLSEAV